MKTQLSAALVAKNSVTVALTNPHDPAAFYQTRTGLYLNNQGYRDRIVRKAKSTQSAPPVTLRRFVLERKANDQEIEVQLGPNHVFSETEVCWIVAEMIGKQEGSAAGDLDNTGKFNLFYTPSWVVDVEGSVGGREWFVTTWRRDGRAWYAGNSVFSRN
jgi:hypothetical protein